MKKVISGDKCMLYKCKPSEFNSVIKGFSKMGFKIGDCTGFSSYLEVEGSRIMKNITEEQYRTISNKLKHGIRIKENPKGVVLVGFNDIIANDNNIEFYLVEITFIQE